MNLKDLNLNRLQELSLINHYGSSLLVHNPALDGTRWSKRSWEYISTFFQVSLQVNQTQTANVSKAILKQLGHPK